MQIVLCDEDPFLREVIEDVVANAGHEVAGIADTTASAVNLIEASRPDAVILDLSLGYTTDFDVIASADAVGARVVVFSRNVDVDALSRYDVKPEIVVKPDFGVLEQVLLNLDRVGIDGEAATEDRRSRPTRAAAGPRPTGVADAQAFFEAINDAQCGDGMLSIDVASGAEDVARDSTRLMRDTDRLLTFPISVRLYLPGSEEVGIRSLLRRIWEAGALPSDCRVASIVVREGELGADAFDRLKQHGEEQPLPTLST